jgi:ribonucleoside-diphosphate reductase alpha chain
MVVETFRLQQLHQFGSISQLTQTTSGIEPAFMVSYTRRKKINPTDTNVKVDYVDAMGDKWQEFLVYHPGFNKWMEISGKTKLEESPYYKSMSNDVDWFASVDIQAAAQKWVSHSISKTCNLPNSATKELVSEIYMKAWEKGCKGFTVYRDGCRSGVLVPTETKKVESDQPEIKMTDKLIKTNSPKRPESLKSDVYHIKVKGQEYFVIVGLWTDNKTPYEVFAGKNGHISKDVKRGEVIKTKRGHYIFKFDNDKTIDNISKYINDEQEAITRMVSLNMRHGVDISFIVHQLEKTTGSLDSFSKAVSRALKKYIQDRNYRSWRTMSKLRRKAC